MKAYLKQSPVKTTLKMKGTRKQTVTKKKKNERENNKP